MSFLAKKILLERQFTFAVGVDRDQYLDYSKFNQCNPKQLMTKPLTSQLQVNVSPTNQRSER